MVYCEGPTEWYVIRKLYKYGILNGDNIAEIDNANVHIINSPSGITKDSILNKPEDWNKFFLVYDLEDYPSLSDFANGKFKHLSPWNQVTNNIFCTQHKGKLVYLHVSNASSPNGYGDFDGYLRELINTAGPQLLRYIIKNLLPAHIRDLVTTDMYSSIHQIGVQEIPTLMQNIEFPIQRSKGYLYAYIVASQISKSHVWFSEKIVEIALENGFVEEVKKVFSSLIEAWDRLIGEQCP